MDRAKGIAFCGLACCVCGQNATCAGCRNDGCKGKDWCKSFSCCRNKGLNGCWECSDYPCDNPMFGKPRVRAFAEIIAEHGEKKLMDRLEVNEKAGMVYHYEGQLLGDYDKAASVDGIKNLVLGLK